MVSPSPAVVGQPVTVAVTITGGAGPGTGNVELQVNGPTYGGPVQLGQGGTANFTIPGNGIPSPGVILFIAPGTCSEGGPPPNTVGVVYQGDSNYLPAIGTVCLAVVPALGASPNPAVYGQPVTYTATVDSLDTGTVSFFDGATNLTTNAPISNGQARFSPALSLAAGNHSITAAFNGQTSYPTPVVISKANTATGLTFTQNGPNVMLTASVAPVAPGAGTPTGSVQFLLGNTVLGSAGVANSKASLAASNVAGTITAVYSGDSNFNGSSSMGRAISALVPPPVAPPVANLSIGSSLNPSMLGQAVTFSAGLTVVSGSGNPTGSVQFLDGSTPIGSASVSGGAASITTSSLTVGSHAIVAQYSGDGTFPSASASLGQVVNRVASTLSLSASAAQVTSAQSVTLTARVGPPPPAGVPAATGQITFSDGATSLGTAAVSGGAASVSAGNLSAGTHQFSAAYSGDKNYTASSASAGVMVTLAPVTITITSTSLGNAIVGQPYSASVGATGGTPPYTWSIGGLPPGLSGDPTGAISGTPTDSGSFGVAVQVTDSKGVTANTTLTLNVTALPLTISASLTNGTQGSNYSGSVTVSGGVPPYKVSISGLPAGLTASASGAITGQPTAAGSATVTVQATDSKGASASGQFTVTIAGTALAISTSLLPGGTAGQPYSAGVAAIGGTPPYTWSGALAAGLSINPASGLIFGTPTVGGSVTLSVTVADSAGAKASSSYTVNFALPALPVFNFTGIGTSANPQTQPGFGVLLTGPFPADLQGTLTLSFQPITGTDSGEVSFATGGRTLMFTIPANSTNGVFLIPTVALQTGTVAGVITITADLRANGLDITPSPAPSKQIQVPAGPPVITSVQATSTSSGFTVAITGYTTTREVTQAVFQFNPASGANLQTSSLSLAAGSLFAGWLQGNQVIGSQFLFTQQFAVQGATTAIASVTVTLANTQGVSAPAMATLQ